MKSGINQTGKPDLSIFMDHRATHIPLWLHSMWLNDIFVSVGVICIVKEVESFCGTQSMRMNLYNTYTCIFLCHVGIVCIVKEVASFGGAQLNLYNIYKYSCVMLVLYALLKKLHHSVGLSHWGWINRIHVHVYSCVM